jgi:hypothetical protein
VKAKFTLIRPKEEGSNQAEVETFEIANIEHIPRIGETIFHGGRDWRVFEVTWNFETGEVFIGACF